MNQKGDTKLAVIFVVLFLFIAAITMFSRFPDVRSKLSFITAHAVKYVPSRNEAVIIGVAVVSIVLLFLLGLLIRRMKQKAPHQSEPEVTFTEPAEITPLLPMTNGNHTNGRSAYDEELEKIEHELNKLQ